MLRREAEAELGRKPAAWKVCAARKKSFRNFNKLWICDGANRTLASYVVSNRRGTIYRAPFVRRPRKTTLWASRY